MNTPTASELLAQIAKQNMPKSGGVKAGGKRLSRIDTSDIAPKAAVNAQRDFPVLPDTDGTAQQLADAFLEAAAAETAAKGNKEMFRGQLIEKAMPFHYQATGGLADPPNSVSVFGRDGEVLVTFKDAYKKLDEPEILERVLGSELTAQYFRQSIEFSIDCDEVPERLVPKVVQLLRAMVAELGIPKALKVKDKIVPTAEWHAARYRALTPEQNVRLEQAFGEKGFGVVAVGQARGRAAK